MSEETNRSTEFNPSVGLHSVQNTPKNPGKLRFRGPSPNVGKATQFKKGQSGNPGGRPKSAPMSDAAREVLAKLVPGDPEGRTYAQAIAQKLADKALSGDLRAAQELADRAEGRAQQSVEIERSELGKAFDRMTREELEAYAVSSALPEWFPRGSKTTE